MLYALCGVILVVAQSAVTLAWKLPNVLIIANEVLGGAYTTIVTCAAFGDVAAMPARALIERGFERGWAVILIGLGTDLFASVGAMGMQSPTIADTILAGAILLMTATLVFATVDATIGEDAWWIVLPAALSRSILVAWRPAIFPRALIVLAIGLMGGLWLPYSFQSALHALHVGQAALWASGLSTAIVIPPVQTLATFIYLDATGYKPKHSCSQ